MERHAVIFITSWYTEDDILVYLMSDLLDGLTVIMTIVAQQ